MVGSPLRHITRTTRPLAQGTGLMLDDSQIARKIDELTLEAANLKADLARYREDLASVGTSSFDRRKDNLQAGLAAEQARHASAMQILSAELARLQTVEALYTSDKPLPGTDRLAEIAVELEQLKGSRKVTRQASKLVEEIEQLDGKQLEALLSALDPALLNKLRNL